MTARKTIHFSPQVKGKKVDEQMSYRKSFSVFLNELCFGISAIQSLVAYHVN